MNRRNFIKSSAAAAATLPPLFNILMPSARGAALPSKMNLVLLLNDQERPTMYFPPNWEQENLPGLTALKQNGITFNNAFCCSAMCTPSRVSLFTGLFPAQHGCTDTLVDGDNGFTFYDAPLNVPNLATVMSSLGYEVVYKGKYHMSTPLADRSGPDGVPDGQINHFDWSPDDLTPYGYNRWQAPDAGENVDLIQFGGGNANNDRRFVTGIGPDGYIAQEGALQYLDRAAQNSRPFCLIVSLVNPHDVLSYPLTYTDGGYDDSWLAGDIELPPTVGENLFTNNKPSAHGQLLVTLAAGLGALPSQEAKTAYLNFYGNLLKLVDSYTLQIYNKLQSLGLLDNTLIVRTSDHGEMGMCHGGLRQKNFNFYEETIRVPLVFSNPALFPEPQTRDGLVSHVDLLPTIAALFQAPLRSNYPFAGRDYSAYLLDGANPPPQEEVVFTYDDVRAGQNVAAVVPPPNRIIAVREARYKLALYYDGDGVEPDQWEMYDLETDPTELTNLYNLSTGTVAAGYEADFERLQQKIYDAMANRLAPLKVRPFVDVQESQVVVSWPGQEHVSYQLQTSTDMSTWADYGAPITGTESPQIVIPTTTEAAPKFFVRVVADNWVPEVPA